MKKTSHFYHLKMERMYLKLEEMREELESTTDLSAHLADLGLEYERNRMYRKLGALMDRITYDVLPHIEKDKITVD